MIFFQYTVDFPTRGPRTCDFITASTSTFVNLFICDYKYSIANICASREKPKHTMKIRQSIQLDRPPYIRLTNF